ncbi:4-phosphoerythronate dehydrogenase [Paraglaciecola aquimarina]|uniref:Erythronate-4-phosphate dehydrogenase n=1 Tax=Paraglaciecola aquimarina TaxID=1235557 RepID=A0ABU3T0N2_9ALTE|nr:4-phosphoerythronate dehydrogenase [Paraglaciecola aquimarina]MDU0355831.1 4-phosphoerythronate dehydrogenase [Paraglaciecola aquimarina]
MKIYYEDSMPYAAEFFADLGEAVVFSHKTIDAETIKDADVLLVRSTTKVNQELLHLATNLKFVGTATAGTDHVDIKYLASRGIPFFSAGGCNAVAVAEYVLSTLFVMADKLDWQVADKTIGIIGAGHVGTALSKHLSALGINYKLCDPPLQDNGDSRTFVSMQEIMQCDVITLHVPWVKDGVYKTENMFDKAQLAQLSDGQVLINACRGEVLNNQAALELFKEGHRFQLVLDVWENEPDINLELMPFTALATAHIAGHTIEGKARGTEMLYLDLCQQLNIQPNKELTDYLPIAAPSDIALESTEPFWQGIRNIVLDVYNIADDDRQFKAQVDGGEQFRYIRKHYPIRREFSAIKVNAGNFVNSKAIYDLGFL